MSKMVHIPVEELIDRFDRHINHQFLHYKDLYRQVKVVAADKMTMEKRIATTLVMNHAQKRYDRITGITDDWKSLKRRLRLAAYNNTWDSKEQEAEFREAITTLVDRLIAFTDEKDFDGVKKQLIDIKERYEDLSGMPEPE